MTQQLLVYIYQTRAGASLEVLVRLLRRLEEGIGLLQPTLIVLPAVDEIYARISMCHGR